MPQQLACRMLPPPPAAARRRLAACAGMLLILHAAWAWTAVPPPRFLTPSLLLALCRAWLKPWGFNGFSKTQTRNRLKQLKQVRGVTAHRGWHSRRGAPAGLDANSNAGPCSMPCQLHNSLPLGAAARLPHEQEQDVMAALRQAADGEAAAAAAVKPRR